MLNAFIRILVPPCRVVDAQRTWASGKLSVDCEAEPPDGGLCRSVLCRFAGAPAEQSACLTLRRASVRMRIEMLTSYFVPLNHLRISHAMRLALRTPLLLHFARLLIVSHVARLLIVSHVPTVQY